MTAFLISLGQSVVFLICIFAGNKSTTNQRACLAAFGFGGANMLLLGVLIGSPAVFFQSGLTLLLAASCVVTKAPPVFIRTFAVLTMAFVYGWAMLLSAHVVEQEKQIRAAYPLVSLEERLAYEEQRSARSVRVTLAPEVEERLRDEESDRRFSGRAFALRMVHNQRREAFNAAMGFGAQRMPRPTMETVDQPELPPVTLPPAPYVPESDAEYVPLAGPPSAPAKEQLLSLHHAGKGDFFDPDRMGYVNDEGLVAGFMSHAFAQAPAAEDATELTDWQIVRLELVSLLKHETPRVYVSEQLPRLDDLENVPTRSPNAFESFALEQLERDEDLVIDDQPHQLRMLGSLRAGKSCLECHAVQRGELLGAFSYELAPLKPVVAPSKDRSAARVSG